MAWNVDDIPDQRGKIAVVTGANSGLGFEASRELARRGARVVMAVRNTEKGQAALERIKADVSTADLELRELDLGSLGSVRVFAARVREDHDRVDILINNAGLMATPAGQTRDGFETQVGTNHLGHFVLTQGADACAGGRAQRSRRDHDEHGARPGPEPDRGPASSSTTTTARGRPTGTASSPTTSSASSSRVGSRLPAPASSASSHTRGSRTPTCRSRRSRAPLRACPGASGRWRRATSACRRCTVPYRRCVPRPIPRPGNGQVYGPRWNMRGAPVVIKLEQDRRRRRTIPPACGTSAKSRPIRCSALATRTKAPVDRAALLRRSLLELVAERGFRGTSMSAVADRAGVAAGTAYVHYDSKDELIIATYVELKADLSAAAVAGLDRGHSLEEQFLQRLAQRLSAPRGRPGAGALHHPGGSLALRRRGTSRAMEQQDPLVAPAPRWRATPSTCRRSSSGTLASALPSVSWPTLVATWTRPAWTRSQGPACGP